VQVNASKSKGKACISLDSFGRFGSLLRRIQVKNPDIVLGLSAIRVYCTCLSVPQQRQDEYHRNDLPVADAQKDREKGENEQRSCGERAYDTTLTFA
jgi:hypothetical protein